MTRLGPLRRLLLHPTLDLLTLHLLAANELAQDPNMYGWVLQAFRKLDPKVNGMSSVEDSVEAQLKIIKGLQPAQSGMFLSHHGNKEWL